MGDRHADFPQRRRQLANPLISYLDKLNIDPDELEWQDLSLCDGADTEEFFDKYERSPRLAQQVDEMCLACPVMKQCTEFAQRRGETGVWGAVYYVNGRADRYKNAHKTAEVWQRIKDKLTA